MNQDDESAPEIVDHRRSDGAARPFNSSDQRAFQDEALKNMSRLARRIVTRARELGRARPSKDEWLTSSALLFAAVEIGRESKNRDSARFLFERVAEGSTGAKYAEQLTAYQARTATAASGAGSSAALTPNAANLMADARVLALRTSQSPQIRGRHLVAALLNAAARKVGGLGRLVDIMGADVAALRHDFAHFITGLFPDQLAEWESYVDDIESGSIHRFVATYNADVTNGNDLLNIDDEVDAFACLIASAELIPPLSIGLFGDWGSGKSFFMRRLRERIADLAKSGDAYFRKRILQIEFNAWHYIDANLWATLVSEIFDRLHEKLRPSSDPTANATESLRLELAKAAGLFREAEEALARAREARLDAQRELEGVQRERTTLRKRAVNAIDDLSALVAEDLDAKDAVATLERELGMPTLVTSARELGARINEGASVVEQGTRLVKSFVTGPGSRRRVALFIASLIAAQLVAIAIGALLAERDVLDTLRRNLTQSAWFLLAAAGWLGELVRRVLKGLATIEAARQKLEASKKRRERAEEAQFQTAIARTEREENDARERLALADSHVKALDQQLTELRPGRRLARLVEERVGSDDYRRHLGVVALIREDLRQLSDFLLAHDEVPVDRIVLYIDDLDRCPPARVVEVLQATHLLLAFPLFVVVVGVDARWISRALETQYAGLLLAGSGNQGTEAPDGVRAAGSIDYLEKVFQVPFWLRPMGAEACHALLTDLLTPHLREEPLDAAVRKEPIPEGPAQISSATRPADPNAAAPSNERAPLSNTPTKTVERPARQRIELLQIARWEIEFAQGLSRFIGPSPRRAKRFANLYRLIKATLSGKEREAYLQHGVRSEDYQAVLVLLAVVTAAPKLANKVLMQVAAAPPNATLDTLARAWREQYSAREDPEARAVVGAFDHYLKTQGSNTPVTSLQKWAPRVARYSFHPHPLSTIS